MGNIVFEDVWKVYRNGIQALRSLSLEIEHGQLFVFLGPSGCGKTTLLRLVAGLESLTAGRISIAGRDVSDKSPKERNVAMVFQNYALYPHMTVYDNIAFGVRSRRVKKTELDRRVRSIAAILELEPLLKKRPGALSGGQQQRVAMGRAIVRDPEAFLLDEPLASLDVRLRAELRGEVARLQREMGVTTLYVTHDQTEAMTLGDRIGVLRNGVLQQVASPSELYRNPRSLFVAGFIGSPPMNLAEATVEESIDGLFVRFSGHRIRADGHRSGDRPGLRDYSWRQVVVGLRPEDILDARTVGHADDVRLRVTVTRREVVGPDVYLHFAVDAPLLLAEDPRQVGVDKLLEESWPVERSNIWLARLDSTEAREGDVVDLAVRPERLYLFDPRTGDVIEQ
jgi:multiple sugar transport system ATP-binding protein